MSKQSDFFKTAYDLGDQRLPSGYGWPLEVDPQVQIYIDKVKSEQKPGRALDIGCGQGRHTFLLADNGYEAYGIDFLERPIKEAEGRAKQEDNNNVHFSVMDVLSLDFPIDYFDLVIDWSVLDHIYPKSWPTYLENINKVTKSGGYLILVEFSSKDKRITNPKQNFFDDQNYDHFFREDEIQTLFGNDFEVIEIAHNELHTTSHFAMVNVLLRKK